MIPVDLPAGWGQAALFEPGETAWPRAARSYDHGGTVLAWKPPEGLQGACDVERLDANSGELPKLLARPPDEDFLEFWTRQEVTAKLANVPIVLALRRRLAQPDMIVIRQRERILCFGTIASAGPPSLETDATSHRLK